MSDLLTISAAQYHADPCPSPSLSSSIAKVLCNDSPRHAWTMHPKLNPNYEPEESGAFDLGTAAHDLLLQGDMNVVIIEANDYRTKAAQEARDAARAEGKNPLLSKVWGDVQAMAKAARTQLDAMKDRPILFTEGRAEHTLTWQEENGVWCRARLDWLRDDLAAIDDLKTTSTTANPEAISRTLFGNGYDLQAAFYLRGLKAVTGHDSIFRFAFVETYPPFATSVVALSPGALLLAEKKCLYAIEEWGKCLESDKWPAYPQRTCYADLPTWVESAWLTKESGGTL
jgi:hypothetical protein